MEKANQNKQNNNGADLRKLLDFFVGQFDKVYQKFDKVNERFDEMNTKIDMIIETKADKADTDEKFNLVLTRIAMINTKIDDYRAEQFAMQRHLDKHEKWHFKTAGKVGVNFLSE